MTGTEREGGGGADRGAAGKRGAVAPAAGKADEAEDAGKPGAEAPAAGKPAPEKRAAGKGGAARLAAEKREAARAMAEKAIAARRSTIEVVAQLDLFGGMAPPLLRRVVAIGVEEQHPRGAKIFEEGETGDRFYLILDGAVRISRFVSGMGEEALAVLRPGAYFGEMSLIDDEARSATAIAHETCRLFVIKRPDLEDLLFVDRDLAYEFLWKLVRTLSRRLRATNDKMTFLASTNKF
jgi:CRP-like cAMP-binding protein